MWNFFKTVLRRFLDLLVNSFALFLGESAQPHGEVERLLTDLENQIVLLQEQIAGMLVQRSRLEQMHRATLALAEDAEREAEDALLRDDKEAARAALRRRLPQARRVEALRAELKEQDRVIADLQRVQSALQRTLAEAQDQQDVLAARERRLETERLIHQALQQYGPASELGSALGKAQDTLAQRQDRLDATIEVEQTSLPRQLAELELEAAVTNDLEALRRRLEEPPLSG